jgi:hypothetical protein
MLTEQRPQTGVDFQRLDLPTVRQGLETLRDAGLAHHCTLTTDQSYWFDRYLTAWDFYRDSQPEGYQLQVESLISAIFGYTLGEQA